MKIAHVGNPANVGWLISRAQRQIGHRADVWVPKPSPFGFGHDSVFRLPKGLRWLELRGYDVLHLHAFRLLPIALETLIPSRQKIILHHHGTDVRLPGEPLGARWAHVRLCNYDLERACPGAVPVPLPVDADAMGSYQEYDNGYVVHLETEPDRTGTRFVEEACRKLDVCVLPWRPVVAGFHSRLNWLNIMSRSTCVVGKVSRISGMPGMVMLEAMAMGKPALCWFSDAVRAHMPECPVVSVTPETLQTRLREVVHDKWLRDELGARGRAYVRRHHRPETVASICLDLYG